MAQIHFFNSAGTNNELTDFEWLKDKVFNGVDEFWEGATGDCALGFADNKDYGSTMTLIGREEFGFMIDHRYSRNDELIQSLRYGKHTGETVTAEIGGNPDPYFKEYCMPKETAWEVIEYFLKTGGRCPKYVWEIAEMPEE
jgi:hypothetical protein